MNKSALQLIFTLLVCIPSMAQTFPAAQDQMVWDGEGKLIVVEGREIADILIREKGKPERKIRVQGGFTSVNFWEGQFWCIERTEKRGLDGAKGVRLFRSADGQNWEPVGSVAEDQPKPNFLMPLETPGLFLGVSYTRGFVAGKQASFFAIYLLDEHQRLTLKELVNLELESPLTVPTKGIDPKIGSFAKLSERYSVLTGFNYHVQPIHFSGGIALVAPRPGIIWLLNGKTGRVRKVVNLFDISEKQLAKSDELEVGILGVQPRLNGDLMIAMRERGAVTIALSAFNYQMKLDTLRAENHMNDIARQQSNALEMFPRLEWKNLNTESGEISDLPLPKGVPKEFKSVSQLKRFKFSFDDKENLILN